MPSKPRVATEKAADILREVPPQEAFYFYRALDSPLNVTARSLGEFAERVKTVDAASLQFHIERQDFERWTAMLGDSDLTARIATIRTSKVQGDQLRPRLYSTVKSRVDQLNRASMKIPR